MNFQRADTSIIKSIRQISLARDWLYLRGTATLPTFADYEPDQRTDDAGDLIVCTVHHVGESLRYECRDVGRRVEMANDAPMKGRFLDACLDPAMVSAARGVWRACIETKLPVYSIVPTADRDGTPVTLEQLYLPFGADHRQPDTMIGSVHAFSTEGRYQLAGLLRQNTPTVPRHWAVVINAAPPPLPAATSDTQVPTRLTSLTFANVMPSDRSRV